MGFGIGRRDGRMFRLGAVSCALLACSLASARTHAEENWPGFLNGGSSQIRAAGVPTVWSPDRNVAWRATVPGYGQSAPVIWGGKIFVTSSDGPWQERGMVHAFDLTTGARLWTTEVPATFRVEMYFRNSRAAPTSVVDRDRIVSLFPGGDVTAMDHAGEILWTASLFQKLGRPLNERGHASSLAQSRDRVFAVVDHDGPSYAVALRKSDGQVAWKTERGSRAPSWSSPVLFRHGDEDLLAMSSTGTLDVYRADTGSLAWQVTGLQGNEIPSATVVGDSLFVGSTQMFHGKADPGRVAASNCRIDLTKGGDEPAFKMRWGAERANSYYSSPLPFAGYVYYVNKSGVLYAVDADTGKRVFVERIGTPCWATGIGVTDAKGESLAYFFMKDGETLVLRPGDSFEEVSRNRLWDADQLEAAAEQAREQRQANRVPADEAPKKTGPDQMFAQMPESALHRVFSYGDPTVYGAAAVDGHLVIRTGQHLYCVRYDTTTD